jgi:hypothetical protein
MHIWSDPALWAELEPCLWLGGLLMLFLVVAYGVTLAHEWAVDNEERLWQPPTALRHTDHDR